MKWLEVQVFRQARSLFVNLQTIFNCCLLLAYRKKQKCSSSPKILILLVLRTVVVFGLAVLVASVLCLFFVLSKGIAPIM